MPRLRRGRAALLRRRGWRAGDGVRCAAARADPVLPRRDTGRRVRRAGDARRGAAGVKFLCIECDAQMHFDDRREPGDGTFAASFRCQVCGRRIAMLANPMETQLVGALGVQIGGRELDEPPLALVQREGGHAIASAGGEATTATGRALSGSSARPTWSDESVLRLAKVPAFVRGMVKRIYTDYAVERG